MALMGTPKAGIIFYTDSQLSEDIALPVREQILKSGLPIVSVSLKPLDFGENHVFHGERGYVTMMSQILLALEKITTKYVFFCEHDVLYPVEHFDFTPPRDDIFYYNSNVWRWQFGTEVAIRYDRMLPLSTLCCNRKLALKFYRFRMKKIQEAGPEAFASREPALARRWGYEPGTKNKRRGGLTDDDFDIWFSKRPVLDIRHKGTFSSPKNTLKSFKHKPSGWQEVLIKDL
jgi:hypothetical protein